MFTFQVTQEHIDQAKANSSAHCMVADALKDAFPQSRFVNVDIQTIRFTRPDLEKRYVFVTPANVVDKIIAFDAGDRDKLRPFKVALQRPQVYGPLYRQGGMPQKLRRAGRTQGEALQDRLLKVIDEHPGVTRNSLRNDVLKDVKGADLDAALAHLEEDGELQRRTLDRSGQQTQSFYRLRQGERMTVGNVRNSRFRRFGVRCLRANQ